MLCCVCCVYNKNDSKEKSEKSKSLAQTMQLIHPVTRGPRSRRCFVLRGHEDEKTG